VCLFTVLRKKLHHRRTDNPRGGNITGVCKQLDAVMNRFRKHYGRSDGFLMSWSLHESYRCSFHRSYAKVVHIASSRLHILVDRQITGERIGNSLMFCNEKKVHVAYLQINSRVHLTNWSKLYDSDFSQMGSGNVISL
jgi:hypothetical protein